MKVNRIPVTRLLLLKQTHQHVNKDRGRQIDGEFRTEDAVTSHVSHIITRNRVNTCLLYTSLLLDLELNLHCCEIKDINNKIDENNKSVEAVSYTHLDVYKRQH